MNRQRIVTSGKAPQRASFQMAQWDQPSFIISLNGFPLADRGASDAKNLEDGCLNLVRKTIWIGLG